MDIVTYLQQQLLPELNPAPVPDIPAPGMNLWYMHRMMEHWVMMQAWHDWTTEIRRYFPTAVSARIERESNYDDEGGYYYTVSQVKVFDGNGERLDRTLNDEQEDEWCDLLNEMDTPPASLCEEDFVLHEIPKWPYTKELSLLAVDAFRTWLDTKVPSTVFQSPELPA